MGKERHCASSHHLVRARQNGTNYLLIILILSILSTCSYKNIIIISLSALPACLLVFYLLPVRI